jgi:DNA polymerase/3'-5' exonuclease PolX
VSTGTRVRLEEAVLAALPLVDLLGIGADRIAIAGSIRRRRPDVGDIEILAVPRIHRETVADGLFELRDVDVDELQAVVDRLLMDGTLASHPDGPKRGPRYSKLVHVASGIQVDLFSVRADTWGVGLLIRTGPRDYSHRFVQEIKQRGWHVGHGFELHRGSLACAYRLAPCDSVATPEEADVYREMGLAFIAPEERA